MAGRYDHIMKEEDDFWLRLEAERIDQQLLLDKDEEYIENCQSPMCVRLPSDSQNTNNAQNKVDVDESSGTEKSNE